MSAWTDVSLVLAGSAGPLAIALISQRSNRQMEMDRWGRDDALRRHDTYAQFVACCTTIVADWSDYILLPPRSPEEERLMDQRRDEHYEELNRLAALVRLTAVPGVAAKAEELLASVRSARSRALELGAADRRGAAGAHAWEKVDKRFGEARKAFIEAGRVGDIKPPD
jgi:hypothetical protein